MNLIRAEPKHLIKDRNLRRVTRKWKYLSGVMWQSVNSLTYTGLVWLTQKGMNISVKNSAKATHGRNTRDDTWAPVWPVGLTTLDTSVVVRGNMEYVVEQWQKKRSWTRWQWGTGWYEEPVQPPEAMVMSGPGLLWRAILIWVATWGHVMFRPVRLPTAMSARAARVCVDVWDPCFHQRPCGCLWCGLPPEAVLMPELCTWLALSHTEGKGRPSGDLNWPTQLPPRPRSRAHPNIYPI